MPSPILTPNLNQMQTEETLDYLQQMLAGKAAANAADAATRERIDGEVGATMDLGIHINPLLERQYGQPPESTPPPSCPPSPAAGEESSDDDEAAMIQAVQERTRAARAALPVGLPTTASVAAAAVAPIATGPVASAALVAVTAPAAVAVPVAVAAPIATAPLAAAPVAAATPVAAAAPVANSSAPIPGKQKARSA